MGKKKKKKKSTVAEPTITQRFQRDITEVFNMNLPSFQDFYATLEDPLHFTARILPQYPPFNKGCFNVNIYFPIEYPFKPPKIVFRTKIYHPNITEQGQISFPLISAEEWKPTTTAVQIIETLIATVEDPVIENRIRIDVANQYLKNKLEFYSTAEKYTKLYAEPQILQFD